MMSSRRVHWLLAAAIGLGVAPGAAAGAGFEGPDGVENQLEEDERQKQPLLEADFLERYRGWKNQVQEDTGIHFGGDYSAQALLSDESVGDDFASSGMVRFFGSWDLVDRSGDQPGALVWKVEHRHRYSDIPPGGYGFEAGYVGVMAAPFSNQRWRTTNLYWRQRFAGGRFSVLAGFLDATDYVDAYALASPWTGFANLTFSTGSASIALPNDAMLGVAAAGMITDHLYAIAGFGDANGDPEDPFEGFETFFEDHEYFSSFELGWTASQEQLMSENVHVTFWHIDERDSAATPSGWGANFSASKLLAEKWMPFLRAGWTQDGGSLLDRSVSAGFSYQAVEGRDQLGAAINWGRPNKDGFGPGLDDQWSFEVFYRWQIFRALAVTPSLQLVLDPALHPSESSLFILGLRLRYAL